MRWRPRSLAGQLALVLVGALVAAQAVAFGLFARERVEAYRDAYREGVSARLASLVRLIEDSPPELHQRIAATANSSLLRISFAARAVVATDPDPDSASNVVAARLAELLARSPQDVQVAFAAEPFGRWGRRGEGESGEARPWRARWLSVSVRLGDGRWLNASTERPPVPPLGRAFLAAFLMSAVSVAVLGAWAVRRMAKPMRSLAEAADRLGRGEPVEALPEAGPEETQRLVAAFNRMQERLDRYVRDRTATLAAVAHDLRTPITTLRLRAEFVSDEEIRAKIVETLDEMQAMAEAGLAFARGESTSEPTRRTDLAALVESVVDDISEQGRDVRLTSSAQERVVLPCRPSAVRRALTNLIENATIYGARARVGLERLDHDVRITVDDEGPGIPSADLERVFEPFVRLEGSRSRETGGAGLGLSLVRSAARGHGGDAWLENRAGGGLRAILSLPLPAEPAES